jgi:transposase InsO family protein
MVPGVNFSNKRRFATSDKEEFSTAGRSTAREHLRRKAGKIRPRSGNLAVQIASTAHRESHDVPSLPFAAPTALYRLSKLAVWWLRLGIHIERIAPGQPHQNGRHERMHLTLKTEATKPAAGNFLQQQARFDTLIEPYNHERPPQGLAMKVPGDPYARSPRVYR